MTENPCVGGSIPPPPQAESNANSTHTPKRTVRSLLMLFHKASLQPNSSPTFLKPNIKLI